MRAGGSDDLPGAGRYILQRGQGWWRLTFEGRHALLKEELGLRYAAELLLRGRQSPIHCAELDARLRGATKPGASGAETVIVHQRSLTRDDIAYLKQLRAKQVELEELLDDENEIEPVKAEAQQQLSAVQAAISSRLSRTADNTSRRVDSVRRAMNRFHRRLAAATDARGRPHAVLRAFGEHLLLYLLLPSGKRCGGRGVEGVKGSFVYLPPAGVVWSEGSDDDARVTTGFAANR